jgi:HPt (histidine-containing phosphotransfer) domain-containing protein
VGNANIRLTFMNHTPTTLSLAELRMPITDVVAKYFGGDAEFFLRYQASCTSQFPLDLSDGQAACSVSDTETLMRTAHNLKSILLTLGFASISQEAAACERCSEGGDVQRAQASWTRLAHMLRFILSSGALQPQPVG